MALAWQLEHWPTVDAFIAHLAKHDPAVARWAVGVTVHHTVIPTVAQWRGVKTMDGMRRHYKGMGWSGAPHLFIGPDGIWQGTPLHLPGIHAGDCNDSHWGVEVVGDYDHGPWLEPINSLARGAITALYRWRGLADAATLKGHRECLPNKSCPGIAIDMDDLRRWLAGELRATPAPVLPLDPAADYTASSPILGVGRATQAQLIAYFGRNLHPQYQPSDLPEITNAILVESERAGVNSDFVAAMIRKEASSADAGQSLGSWWAARPRRNGCGYGVTGQSTPARDRHGRPIPIPRTWSSGRTINPGVVAWSRLGDTWWEGVSFESWARGSIPAQVSRMLIYARRYVDLTPEQRKGVDHALYIRPLDPIRHGSAPTLRQLGAAHNPTGQAWASPGHTYGQSLADIANAIVRTRA